MAMNVGGGGGIKAEINVTPLVDVVLVLLIIFMVVTPLMQMGYEVQTPPEVKSDMPQPPASDQLILRLDKDGSVHINKDAIPPSMFPERVRALMKNRGNKLAFFAAHGDIPYERVVQFLDLCRENGATNLGIVFEDIGRD